MAALGFDTPKGLTEFVTAQREAEQAALTEVERREQASAERKLQTACREELAAERERAAQRCGPWRLLGERRAKLLADPLKVTAGQQWRGREPLPMVFGRASAAAVNWRDT
ncbi:hypothetical protein SSP24_42240 [Streptomyces spinoverrucosus]|uniref:Uncharacterized protein n=1 Tax=Streptomyces spinoverrucosus TaxID=284043 RepID=A0A4Y3VLR9_9ACTN|nr:hypothetical protein [Streptomyces spinoverrucosus]GEC06569.1 hypothetical protein SSP24_42240 [Streptomyces spinoverrucosus]GHB54273.1 hypothetical protein GCM10010397_25610 [Streptomyces spinoverrucosus]